MNNRLAILVCYDPDGIIDDYILYLLNDLLKNISRLIIVFNGNLTESGKKRLLPYTNEIIERENSDFDVEAWKQALINYLGWNELRKYDELLLINDTFYGPFVHFKTIFDRMERSNADFWGLTSHAKDKDYELGYIPEYIQSYFILIRKSMFNSADFHNYWESMPQIKTSKDATRKYETAFTKHFSDLGYSWEVVFNNGEKDKNIAYDPTILNPLELLEDGFPFVKRELFVASPRYIYGGTQNEIAARTIDWIRNNADYDLGLIFHNLLRLYNIADISNAVNLNYIVDNNYLYNEISSNKKAAVWVHIYYTDDISRYLRYLKNIPVNVDVFVTTDSDEKVLKIKNVLANSLSNNIEVIKKDNRGRDISSLLVVGRKYFCNYDYVCFCHDKMSKQIKYTFAKSFENLLWENLLSSREYINNILSIFELNPCLGVLTVPPVYHPSMAADGWWQGDFEITSNLLKEFGVNVPISKDKECISIGTALWFRPEALKPILDYTWKYEDFPEEPMPFDATVSHAIERCFPFVAQSQGYYTGTCMTKEYAAIMLNNYKYSITHYLETLDSIPMDVDVLGEFLGVKKATKLVKVTLRKFIKKTHKIFGYVKNFTYFRHTT